MRERVRSSLGAALFVIGPMLAVVALHRLGQVSWLAIDWSNPAGWLQRATLEEALAALLRMVGLLAGYWLAGSTLLYVLAVATEIPSLIRTATPLTLPIARRLVDGALITTIAVSSLAAPLIARTDDSRIHDGVVTVLPPPQLVEQAGPRSETDIRAEPSTSGEVDLPPAHRDPVPPAPRAELPAVNPGDTTVIEVVVRTGDNLWVLSERRLAETLGRPPRHSEVDPYWRQVMAVNAGRLRSGDPDLIYPGEVIILPPTTDR